MTAITDVRAAAADKIAGNARRPEALSAGPSRSPGLGTGRRTMQQRLYWLDYDPVALAVLVIGMGVIELLALLM